MAINKFVESEEAPGVLVPAEGSYIPPYVTIIMMKMGELFEILGLVSTTLNVMSAEAKLNTERIQRLEHITRTTLWVCGNPECGAPNEIPAIMWRYPYAVFCTTCHYAQHPSWIKQFTPKETDDVVPDHQ